jgi:hypothetical protein
MFSCASEDQNLLQRTNLFQLQLGKMEDQIDFFQQDNASFEAKTRLFMRAGTVFISNGSSAKVMQFSSYGDLLKMYYNSDKNPAPVILQKVTDGSTIRNKIAIEYPLLENGAIAVSSTMKLYIEDQIGRERGIIDDATSSLFQYVVLRFDEQGKFIGYIGQEGIGGNPFPYIENIFVTNNDDLVVLARTVKDWRVYWYDSNGLPKSRTRFLVQDLPKLANSEEAIPDLETIIPDNNQHSLHLKISYFQDTIDSLTGSRSGIDSTVSRIYKFDIEAGKYIQFIDVPTNVKLYRLSSTQEESQMLFHYELLAVFAEGYYYLLSRELNNKYQFLILDLSGESIAKRYLAIEDTELIYRTFNVSAEGILTALLGKEYGADIVWWRTDSLVRE